MHMKCNESEINDFPTGFNRLKEYEREKDVKEKKNTTKITRFRNSFQ